MVENHSYSIFGQATGMLINSKAEDLYWFVRFIKKKPDGSWEKPSQGEGKVIKFSLDETVMILRVLNGLQDKWSTVHDYKNQKTQISFSKNEEGSFWINVDKYAKALNFAQIEVLRYLIIHFFHEKIECATIPTLQKQKEETEKQIEETLQQDIKEHEKKNNPKSPPKPQNTSEKLISQISKETGLETFVIETMVQEKVDELKGLLSVDGALRFIAKEFGVNVVEEVEEEPHQSNNPFQDEIEHHTTISAILKAETQKAFLINTKDTFGQDVEMWIPKSTLKNEVQFQKDKTAELVVINWILRKNNIIEQK